MNTLCEQKVDFLHVNHDGTQTLYFEELHQVHFVCCYVVDLIVVIRI
jgi:hypothetical protein